jgi:hypothetical protein
MNPAIEVTECRQWHVTVTRGDADWPSYTEHPRGRLICPQSLRFTIRLRRDGSLSRRGSYGIRVTGHWVLKDGSAGGSCGTRYMPDDQHFHEPYVQEALRKIRAAHILTT